MASSAQSKTILMLDAAMIRKFASGLNGHLVLPGDDVLRIGPQSLELGGRRSSRNDRALRESR